MQSCSGTTGVSCKLSQTWHMKQNSRYEWFVLELLCAVHKQSHIVSMSHLTLRERWVIINVHRVLILQPGGKCPTKGMNISLWVNNGTCQAGFLIQIVGKTYESQRARMLFSCFLTELVDGSVDRKHTRKAGGAFIWKHTLKSVNDVISLLTVVPLLTLKLFLRSFSRSSVLLNNTSTGGRLR